MEIPRGLLLIARLRSRLVGSAVLVLPVALMAGVSQGRAGQPAEHADRTAAVRSDEFRGMASQLDLLGFSQGVRPGSASLRLARYQIFRIPPIRNSPEPDAARSFSASTESQPRRVAKPQRPAPAHRAGPAFTLHVPAPELRPPVGAPNRVIGSVDRTAKAAPEKEKENLVSDPVRPSPLVLAPPAAAADGQPTTTAASPSSPASESNTSNRGLGSEDVALPVPASSVLASSSTASPASVPAPEDPALPVPASGAHQPVRGDGWSARAPRVAPAVADRTRQLIEEGIRLAERGALYSARARFVMALRLVTQALDMQTQSQRFSRSLADGMRALDEAQDFQPRGSRLEAQLDLPQVVSTHRTTILKTTDLSQWTAMAALQRYYLYAEEQLSRAAGREMAAADALYGLARLQPFLNSRTDDCQSASGPTAMSLYQAALIVHPQHYLAANELGTLFAHFGQWQDARDVLRHAAAARPDCPVVWRNLAQVHEQLAEHDLAALARHEYQVALRCSEQPSATDPRPAVQWVDPETFAALSHDDGNPPSTLPTATTRPQSTSKPAKDTPRTRSDRRQASSRPSAQDQPMSAGQRLGSRDAYGKPTPETAYRRW